MNSQAVMIHTDGSCLKNPGPGGFGALIETCDGMITIRGGHPDTTNNRMELTAAIEALALLREQKDSRDTGPLEVTIRTDSKYLCDAFNKDRIGNWRKNNWRTSRNTPVENRDLWERLIGLTAGQRSVQWVWVKGHNGDPKNERCDQIARGEAECAKAAPGPWVTTTETPKLEHSGVKEQTQDPLEDAIVLGQRAATCAELALYKSGSGEPENAWATLEKALNALREQEKILREMDVQRA